MVTRKAAAKSARKVVAKTDRKSKAKASSEVSSDVTADNNSAPANRVRRNDASDNGSIRIRMYRIGFGDFFLLTVPGKNGPAHILIDCGVHAANIKTIDECVKNMKTETGNHLALVILTHYHADHMSGFASNYDDFAAFDVGAVWITNRLDPGNKDASKFMAQLTSVAQQLKLQLGVRHDPGAIEAQHKVENALGVSEDGGGGSNAKALKLLQSGFRNNPPVYYYQGGDTPTLPDELEGVITAEILAPSPKDSGGEFAAADNKVEQYLAALGENGVPNTATAKPFNSTKWPATVWDYPQKTFDEFIGGVTSQTPQREPKGASLLESTLEGMQPDQLAAAADKLDGTLNNQSLVVLFTCNGKKLLFVGDAQWGNWAYWLYGKSVTGSAPSISARAKEILGSIDFYKVGHHGSTNATPIPVVEALKQQCSAMCSTATGAYGSTAKKTEVPRTALMDALEARCGNRLVRSDWVAAGDAPPDEQAQQELPQLPSGFSTPGELYIDYVF